MRTRLTLGAALALGLLAGCPQQASNNPTDARAPDRREAAPPSHDEPTSQPADPTTLVGDRAHPRLRKPEHRELEYWRSKPTVPMLFTYSLESQADEIERRLVTRMQAGLFQPYSAFEPLPLGVPPPWDVNPLDDPTWDFYRHALTWLAPAVEVWAADADEQAFELVRATISDWAGKNVPPPGVSPFAWSDHGISKRLRLFCWIWELYRASPQFESAFAGDLLTLIYTHADAIASGAAYNGRSNHGLEQNVALLGAAANLPELVGSEEWLDIVRQRLEAYVRDNFDELGFHREQSPEYHKYVIDRLGPVLRFARINDITLPQEIENATRRAVSVLPWLARPDGTLPPLGDSEIVRLPAPEHFDQWLGDTPAPAASIHDNPRRDGAGLLVSADVGYAVFTSYVPRDSVPPDGTHIVFRCNSFPYSHAQRDGLSFVLYARGRDWIVDSGKYLYKQGPGRDYVLGRRGHNVVLIDNQESEWGPMAVTRIERGADADAVTVSYDLPQARHVRTLSFHPPLKLVVTDQLKSTDGRPHVFSQLFHIAPEIAAHAESDRVLRLSTPDGATVLVTQLGTAGQWEIVAGQEEPHWQGWYSPTFGDRLATPAVHYHADAASDAVFETHIEIVVGR